MKQIILSMVIGLTAIVATAQMDSPHHSANYEAGSWNTWLLDNPQQITMTPPPLAAQSKAELQAIKQGMATLDQKKMDQIKYWDAGAPA